MMNRVALTAIGHVFVVAAAQIIILITVAFAFHPFPASNAIVGGLLLGYLAAGLGHVYAVSKSRWHVEERFIVGGAVLAAWTAPLSWVLFDASGYELAWVMRLLGFILAMFAVGGVFVAVGLGKKDFGGWLPSLLSLPWGVTSFVALGTLGHVRLGEMALGTWLLWVAFIGIPPLWRRLTSKTMSAG